MSPRRRRRSTARLARASRSTDVATVPRTSSFSPGRSCSARASVSSFWASWLWPAEPTFPAESPIDSVRFHYPDRDLGLLPGGAFGVLLTFLVASIVFGIAILKPLHIQI